MAPATKDIGQKRETRWWNQAIIDFFVIGGFRKEEVMDRREGQHGFELTFQPCEEFLALVAVKQHYVAHAQLENTLIMKEIGKWFGGKYGAGTESKKAPSCDVHGLPRCTNPDQR
jgi:hypothetical protein